MDRLHVQVIFIGHFRRQLGTQRGNVPVLLPYYSVHVSASVSYTENPLKQKLNLPRLIFFNVSRSTFLNEPDCWLIKNV